MKKGFTIVELLIVIAIIGILGGIITSAAVGALRSGRAKRAEAMRSALEQAVATYYAQEGKWPETIENKLKNLDTNSYTFDPKETDEIFREVVGKGFGKGKGERSQMIDATALFVCDSSKVGNSDRGCYDNHSNQKKRETYCGGRGCTHGMDFSAATAKGAKRHLPLSQMSFGYAGTETGNFCRYWITYNAKTDSVKVRKVGPSLSGNQNNGDE